MSAFLKLFLTELLKIMIIMTSLGESRSITMASTHIVLMMSQSVFRTLQIWTHLIRTATLWGGTRCTFSKSLHRWGNSDAMVKVVWPRQHMNPGRLVLVLTTKCMGPFPHLSVVSIHKWGPEPHVPLGMLPWGHSTSVNLIKRKHQREPT